MLNAHYDSHEAYVFALARQMRKEYELIARDFILQIDAPDLALERTVLFQDKSVAEFVKIAEMHVAALNEALAGIPRERIRLHCCWGNYDGPHIHDVPLADILPVLTQAKVGALSIEFANPRHQHEYAALKKAKLPPEFLLLPGVIDIEDELRRASRGRGQPHLRGGRRGRRPQPGHRLRATAASAPSPAPSWSPKTSSGQSSGAAARAPTSRPGGCGAGSLSSAPGGRRRSCRRPRSRR